MIRPVDIGYQATQVIHLLIGPISTGYLKMNRLRPAGDNGSLHKTTMPGTRSYSTHQGPSWKWARTKLICWLYNWWTFWLHTKWSQTLEVTDSIFSTIPRGTACSKKTGPYNTDLSHNWEVSETRTHKSTLSKDEDSSDVGNSIATSVGPEMEESAHTFNREW